jgi:hypothetical protein
LISLYLSQAFYSHEVIVAIQKAALVAKSQKTSQYQTSKAKLAPGKNPPKDKDNPEEKRKHNEQKLQAHLTIESKRFLSCLLISNHRNTIVDIGPCFENLTKQSARLKLFSIF